MNKKENLKGNKGLNEKTPNSRSEFAGVKVKIVDFDQRTNRVKIVKVDDNLPLLKDQRVTEKIDQKKAYNPSVEKSLKTSQDDRAPIMAVNDSYASLRGNNDYGFFSYRDGGGNIIKGPLSLATGPEQIRLSGLSTLNPLITSGFASTIVTPLPATVWKLPTAAAVKPLLKDVLIVSTLAAAMGVA